MLWAVNRDAYTFLIINVNAQFILEIEMHT